MTETPFAYAHYRLSASIGIVLIPTHGDNIQDLLANADLAMYQSKQAGRGRYRFHFQPIAEAHGQTIVYHEALLRLEQEDGTLILPDTVIDAAQRCSLMPAIDCFVVEEALKLLPTSLHPSHPLLAVNLSAYALTETRWINTLKKPGQIQPAQSPASFCSRSQK